VYRCDEFSVEFGGFEDIIHLKPNYEERDNSDGAWVYKNLLGVVVYAKDNSGTIFTEYVDFKRLEKLRTKSANQKPGQLSFIWLEWAEEMYKAKALKYVISRLPITEDVAEVVVKEDQVLKTQPVPKKQPQQQDINKLLTANTISEQNEVTLIEPEIEMVENVS